MREIVKERIEALERIYGIKNGRPSGEKLSKNYKVSQTQKELAEVGRKIVELERIYGIQNGNNQHKRMSNNLTPTLTQEELAKKIGTTARTMQNYKRLLTMIPELEDLVDTGIVSTATAVAIVGEDQCGSGGGKNPRGCF